MMDKIIGVIELLVAEILGPAYDIVYAENKIAAAITNPRLARLVNASKNQDIAQLRQNHPGYPRFGTTTIKTKMVVKGFTYPGVVQSNLITDRIIAQIEYDYDILIVTSLLIGSTDHTLLYCDPQLIDQLTEYLQTILKLSREWGFTT